MGILALVLYVLGMVPIWSVLTEDHPETSGFYKIVISAIWPVLAIVAVVRGLYGRFFKK